jgi:erythromycin esterase-like protein
LPGDTFTVKRLLAPFLLILWTARSVLAEDLDPAAAIATLLQQTQVVILGEHHRQPESPRLVVAAVKAYLEAGGCLTVALEIPSDQQPTLDAAMRGKVPISAVRIHSVIDHPAYREMLAEFRDLIRAGRCLRVHAVDSPKEDSEPRDAWMAKEIQALIVNGPVLVLLGNLHALKVAMSGGEKDSPFLAERLVRRGIQVLSVLQDWEMDCGERAGRLLDIHHPRAVAALQSTVDVAAAYPPETPKGVVDRVVVWECIPKR